MYVYAYVYTIDISQRLIKNYYQALKNESLWQDYRRVPQNKFPQLSLPHATSFTISSSLCEGTINNVHRPLPRQRARTMLLKRYKGLSAKLVA